MRAEHKSVPSEYRIETSKAVQLRNIINEKIKDQLRLKEAESRLKEDKPKLKKDEPFEVFKVTIGASHGKRVVVIDFFIKEDREEFIQWLRAQDEARDEAKNNVFDIVQIDLKIARVLLNKAQIEKLLKILNPPQNTAPSFDDLVEEYDQVKKNEDAEKRIKPSAAPEASKNTNTSSAQQDVVIEIKKQERIHAPKTREILAEYQNELGMRIANGNKYHISEYVKNIGIFGSFANNISKKFGAVTAEDKYAAVAQILKVLNGDAESNTLVNHLTAINDGKLKRIYEALTQRKEGRFPGISELKELKSKQITESKPVTSNSKRLSQ